MDTPLEADSPADLLTHLPLCERVVGALARRRCLSPDEQEDFTSWARLRLVENGEAILGSFQGRSTLSTYLTTVAVNLFRDYRIAKWGKFRPSAAAKRMGTVAVRLEMLTARDGVPLDEAVEILRRNEGVNEAAEELEAMAAKLPVRAPRRFEGEETLASLPARDRAEDRALRHEAAAAAGRVEAALDEGLRTLSAEDRLILKMRVQDGFTVADIARSLHLEQKPLYRRLEQLTSRLRQEMESRGVRREDVDDVVEWEEVEIRVDYHLGDENPQLRPSKKEGGA
jgi:RNA polymerase sigma factor (sigma-70 family)